MHNGRQWHGGRHWHDQRSNAGFRQSHYIVLVFMVSVVITGFHGFPWSSLVFMVSVVIIGFHSHNTCTF